MKIRSEDNKNYYSKLLKKIMMEYLDIRIFLGISGYLNFDPVYDFDAKMKE